MSGQDFFELLQMRLVLAERFAATTHRGFGQVEQIRASDLHTLDRRQPSRQQVLQASEIAGRADALLLLTQRLHRVHEEDFGDLELRTELFAPVVSDVLIDSGMSLHEQQSHARRGHVEFVDDFRVAIFLLSRCVN